MHPLLFPATPFGKLLRLPLKAVPRTAVMPVLSGANRGLRWSVAAGTDGCWIGTYEREEIARFLRLVNRTSIVWDIGAHAGYFSMACRKAAALVCCEPLAANVAHLNRHIALNGLHHFTVVPAAISDRHCAKARFGGHESSYQNRIGNEGEEVETATIDGLVAEGLPAPTIIKMDIEGAELQALPGARETLLQHRPTIMVATHGDAAMAFVSVFLNELGYRTEVLDDCVWGYSGSLR